MTNYQLICELLGNYDGLGEQRKTEVLNSCAMLGISSDHCVVLDHPELQDNPKKMWDKKLIEVAVAPYLKKWKTDLVSISIIRPSDTAGLVFLNMNK